MVFAFLKALSVTYSASASRESFESRQGHAPEQETTETQSFESMSPHATGLTATSAHAAGRARDRADVRTSPNLIKPGDRRDGWTSARG